MAEISAFNHPTAGKACHLGVRCPDWKLCFTARTEMNFSLWQKLFKNLCVDRSLSTIFYIDKNTQTKHKIQKGYPQKKWHFFFAGSSRNKQKNSIIGLTHLICLLRFHSIGYAFILFNTLKFQLKLRYYRRQLNEAIANLFLLAKGIFLFNKASNGFAIFFIFSQFYFERKFFE